MTLRIGWFSPISQQTGIASYSAQVLEALCADTSGDDVEVIVFHPPFSGGRVDMPCPTIELSDALLNSDFWALFDVAVYHVGNNSRHHTHIYNAMLRHPGMVVLHDYVYQHYLAGVSLRNDFVGTSYVTLAQNADAGSFSVLQSSGVMRANQGQVHFVPWESEWSTRVPLSDRFVDLGLSSVVHSEYARSGIVDGPAATHRDVLTLFMPRPEVENAKPPRIAGGPIRIACCGHIGGTKGLIELVNSFLQAPRLQQSFHVTIAGFASDSAFLQLLRKTISEARLNAVFEIKIAPSDEAYREVMSNCDVFFNLRYPNTEGASLSLMEQLAYARPVIAYRTGSFAEVPDAACYYLDTVGDTQALTDMLVHIADHPDEITQKGQAAQAAVAGKTAKAYAAQFLEHVSANLETYQHRARLSHMRASGVLEHDKKDRSWLQPFLRARREMRDFYAGALYVPTHFLDMPTRAKGDFVASNYLNTTLEPSNATRIGTLLEGLPAVALHDVLGKLLTINSLGAGGEMLDETLHKTVLPITDIRIWQILSCLPPRVGGFLGLHALGQAVTSDTHDALTLAITQRGFRSAIRALLQELPNAWTRRITNTPLLDFLEDASEEETAALPAVPLGVNVLDHLRMSGASSAAIMLGFHELEPVGVWTGQTRAALHVRLEEHDTVGLARGTVAALPHTISAGDTARLTIEELSSGRRAECVLSFEGAQGNTVGWELPLDNLSGALAIRLEVSQLYTLSEDGRTGDTRALGVLLQNLVLLRPEPAAHDGVAQDVVA
ncbi:MAG: glycosyltransferase [Tateyamaria sp.]